MGTENSNSDTVKKDNLIVTGVTESKHLNRVWFHIRILYSISLIILLGVLCAIWIGYRELEKVKLELRKEIILESRRYVEFNPEFRNSNIGADVKYYSHLPNEEEEDHLGMH